MIVNNKYIIRARLSGQREINTHDLSQFFLFPLPLSPLYVCQFFGDYVDYVAYLLRGKELRDFSPRLRDIRRCLRCLLDDCLRVSFCKTGRSQPARQLSSQTMEQL